MTMPDDSKVTMTTLLQEMLDRDAVARIATPSYQCKQASSWDRSQTEVGGENWYANKDYDEYLRLEKGSGREEYVVMEDDGPGCVTRIWRPLDIGNNLPKATIRFYLDGSEDPALVADCTELLSAQSIFPEPFSFIASDEVDSPDQIGLPPGEKQMGGNLYFPIPYAKGCKVTLEPHYKSDSAEHNVFFYIFNYRSYEEGTVVESFSHERYHAVKELVQQIGKSLKAPGTDLQSGEFLKTKEDVDAGGSVMIDIPKGPGAVRKVVVKIDPEVEPSAMRDLWVSMSFDGEETVLCPISEFFGGGYFAEDSHPEKPESDGHFIRPHWNRHRRSEEDGNFSCYFVMPYESSATVGVKNMGGTTVNIEISLDVGEWTWDDRSMHFHANWRSGLTPGEEADWNYIEIQGQGTYIADTLSVYNPSKKWYGEGDERIYIDGESFPSHLGTGTEDYYGYAWGMANLWNSSFISAPSRDSRGKADWSGHQTVSRERMLDAIPFATSLKFDMEVGCWFPIQATYSVGVMWYGRPGAKSSNYIAEQSAKSQRGDPST